MIKSVVLPYDVFNKLNTSTNTQNPALDRLSRMEEELQNILNNKTASDDEKVLMYTQLLDKYLKIVNSNKGPIELPVNTTEQPITSNTAQPTSTPQATHSNQKHLLSMATHRINSRAATSIMSFIENSPSITWNDATGRVSINNTEVANSNIVDIIVDLASPPAHKRNKPPPPGTAVVLSHLTSLNIPATFIKNTRRAATPAHPYPLKMSTASSVLNESQSYLTPLSTTPKGISQHEVEQSTTPGVIQKQTARKLKKRIKPYPALGDIPRWSQLTSDESSGEDL